MIGLLNTVNVAIAGALDNEVSDWYTNVRNDGGEADSSTLGALSEFMFTLKINNIRSKIKRCNMFCGHNLRSSLHPIIKSAKEGGVTIGYEKDINSGFVNSDYAPGRGLWAINAALQLPAQKYLSTGVFISEAGITGAGGHLSFMGTPSTNPTQLYDIGGYMSPLNGGDNQSSFDLSAYIEFDSGQGTIKGASASASAPGQEGHAEVDLYGAGIDGLDNANDVSGLWVASRESSTIQKLYRGNEEGVIQVNEFSNENDQTTFPIGGYKFRVFGSTPANGLVTQTSSYKLLFYAIGETMSESEITILNNALIKFNTALGRI